MIYKGAWSCQESYISGTGRNIEIRWQEDTQKDSEAAKHLKHNPTHSFTWKVLVPASSIRYIREKHGSTNNSTKQPTMNELSLRNYCYFQMVSLDDLSFYL